MSPQKIICHGCGLEFYSTNYSIDKDLNALQVCRELYFQLTYYTLSLQDEEFIHQLAVDAYTAQHFGPQVKPIAITFALVGLYLINEKNYNGKQVQDIHIALAKKSKTWPEFFPPQNKASLTIRDVIQSSDEDKNITIKKWHSSVWKIWQRDEKQITTMLNNLLAIG